MPLDFLSSIDITGTAVKQKWTDSDAPSLTFGLQSEVGGQLYDFGTNFTQLGDRKTDYAGGFMRIDLREAYANQFFNVKLIPPLGVETDIFNLSRTGDIVTIGSITGTVISGTTCLSSSVIVENGVRLTNKYLASGATAVNSKALCGCTPACFLGATACANDSAKLGAKLPAYYLNTGSTALCATTAGNALGLCGCTPACFLGTSACAADSAKLNNRLPAYYLNTGSTSICSTTAGNALCLGGNLACTFAQTNAPTFTGTVQGASLQLSGDLTVSGTMHTVHAEDVYTKNDFMFFRSGATSGLGVSQISGIAILKADNTNTVIFGSDKDAIMRVGWSGDTLVALAGREDVPINGGYAKWDSGTTKFVTYDLKTYIDTCDTSKANKTSISTYTGTTAPATYLGINATASDSAKLGNRLPAYYLNTGSTANAQQTNYTVHQALHGFSVGDIIKSNGANVYEKATADNSANSEVVGIVTAVINSGVYTFVSQGIIETGVPVQPAGTVMFLSPTSGGTLTTTEPTTVGQISKPLVVILESGNRALFQIFRGMEITADGSYAPLNSPAITGSGSWDSPTFVIDATNHRVGIGTTAPLYKLHVSQVANAGIAKFGSAYYNRALRLGIDSGGEPSIQALIDNTDVARQLSINPEGGNVGIGTNAPLNKFTVKVATDQNIGIRQANGYASLGTFNDVGTAYIRLDIDASVLNLNGISGGNVGIGTTAPNNMLHIKHGAAIDPFRIESTVAGGHSWSLGDGVGVTAGFFSLYDSTSGFAVVAFQGANGYVFNHLNSASWNVSSDIRIKENIVTIPNAIDTLNSLRPVLFDYTKDFADKRKWNEERRIGNYSFIAQEFETVFPKSVTKSEEEINGEKVDDFRSLSTDSLVPILVKAVQELKAQNDSLLNRIEALENK